MTALRPMPFITFAEKVLRLRLTVGQGVLCKVAFDGVDPRDLGDGERAVAAQIFHDIEDVPTLARRILVLLLGRGSGKTTLSAAYGLWRMVTADLSVCGPGDLPHVVVVAPTKKTAGLAVRMGLGMVAGSPELRGRVETETSEGFVLQRSDGRLVAFAAFAASRGGASARGLSILSFILDEAQFFQSDAEFVITDRDVFSAIVPRLMPGGSGVFISTPWPVQTLMGELFEKNYGAPSTALAALAPTLLMRGDEQTASLVASERARDPENAAREFDCDTSSGAGSSAFFDPAAIKQCVDVELLLPQPRPDGEAVSFGADLAFVRDSSTLVGVSESGDLLVLEELRPQKGSPLRPKYVVDTFAATVTRYGSGGWTADAHYRESAREHMEPHSLEFRDAPGGRDGKAETYLHARKLLAEVRVRLPDHPRLVAQLRSIVSKPMPGGGLAITAPRRMGLGHADLASAWVLALWAAKEGEMPGWVRAMQALSGTLPERTRSQPAAATTGPAAPPREAFDPHVAQTQIAEALGFFDPSFLYARRSGPPPSVVCSSGPTSMHEIRGRAPFSASETASFTTNGPATFSERSSEAFRLAVAAYRSKHCL